MSRPMMTRADAAELWDLLCLVDGRHAATPFASDVDIDIDAAVDAWWEMARQFRWSRAEVLDAVDVVARWAREDGWRWPVGDTDTQPPGRKPIMPAHLNDVINLRRSFRPAADHA